MPTNADEVDTRAAHTLSRWLDDRFLDPLIGFVIPGGGDVVSSVLGLYIVALGHKKGLSAGVLARMLLNLAIDALVGAVPVAGDLFDVFYKANKKNLQLLEERSAGEPSKLSDWILVLLAFMLLLLALAVPITLGIWLAKQL